MINVRRMSWAGYVVRIGENRNAYIILVGKKVSKRLLGKARRRWVENIQ
jgi:hypothetical protein